MGKLTTAPVQRLKRPRPLPGHFPPPLLTPVPLSNASAYMHNFTIISGRVAPAAFSRFRWGGGYFLSHPVYYVCIISSAPLVEFSITSHVHDTLRSVPPWGLQQERLWSSFFLTVLWGQTNIFLWDFLRGNYSIETSACVLCEHESAQQLSVQHCASWVQRHNTAGYELWFIYILLTNIPRQKHLPRVKRISWPFHHFIPQFIFDPAGNANPRRMSTVGENGQHNDSVWSSWNQAAADFSEEIRLSFSKVTHS